MTSAVKSKKFNTLFDWFDLNGDGQLSQEDLRGTADVFARTATRDDQATIRALHDAFARWWDLLLEHGDTDGDGQVSRQEFLTVMKADVTTPAHFEGTVLAIADALLNAYDTNGDGVLSKEEYVHMYEQLGVPRVHSEQAFPRLDRDGNGVISLDEFREAIIEFYLSDDPAAPGNFLLGPIG
ncbi:EF-hand domain-containing protein [Kitasatospora xanthocidica]|uniref:EF-hand domain-containing protein n=1 Tax=Kitasatospora xanthocidica TaxID=83382 RepID=A0A372ZNQ7_9ACTN|nr:EF-hand domain-containing protein [Kitasatospora xanthocidica]RGD57528.1 EF-hand domain-containing protein [Kitasatospora xanthocidica]